MKGERAFVPLILTAVVLGLAKQWPQSLWRWIYLNVHINNATFGPVSTIGQTNQSLLNAPGPSAGPWSNISAVPTPTAPTQTWSPTGTPAQTWQGWNTP